MRAKMRLCLCVLLAVVLCTGQAHALKCYTCMAQSSNAQCQTPTDCADGGKYCVTITGTDKSGSPGEMRITKLCLPMCKVDAQDPSLGMTSVSCCQGDFCNRSRATAVGTNYMTLWGGIWASFIWLLLWTGL